MLQLKKTIWFGLVYLLAIGKSEAQVYSPFSYSNYAGVYGMSLNPSFTAFDKHNWHLNLIGAGLNVNNNYLRLNMPYSPYKAANNKVPSEYQTANGNASFDKTWLLRKSATQPKHASAQAYIMGPSLMIKAKSWKLGIVTEAYANARAFCIDRKLADAVYLEFDSLQGAFDLAITEAAKGEVNTKGGTIAASGYAVIGFHVSRAWDFQWNKKIAIGITPKMAFGFGFAGLKYDKFSITDIFSDSIRLSQFSAESRQSRDRKRAFGGDIGITYVYNKPSPRQNGKYRTNKTKYHSKIGLAILNLGRFKYNANVTSVQSAGEIAMAKSDFENLNSSDADSTAGSIFRNYGAITQSAATTKVGLPTALHLSIDHQLKPTIFMAVSIVQSLRKRNSYHMRQQSYVMLTPRYEKKHWEVGIPLGLIYDYRAVRMGLYVRFGPVFIGTHSLNGIFNTRNAGDADFFFGISIGNLGKPKSKIEKEKEGLNKGSKPDKCGEF